jgi:hypothetical protein
MRIGRSIPVNIRRLLLSDWQQSGSRSPVRAGEDFNLSEDNEVPERATLITLTSSTSKDRNAPIVTNFYPVRPNPFRVQVG